MDDPIERWHAFLATRDFAILDGLLAEDVVFESPVVFTPQRGKAIVMAYLGAAAQLLGGESFCYRNTWRSESSAVLEFEAELDAIAVNGVDIIAWNGDGRIAHFKVMLRPLQAVNIVHKKMGELLARARP
jgi:hypothetical protein